MSDSEFELLMSESKSIDSDIGWSIDEDHSPTVEFRVNVECSVQGLSVKGSFNTLAGKLSYVLIHQGTGRIYALDLGADHHNPDCNNVGELHKHRWSEDSRDKYAYVPSDITAPANEPHRVWKQFCAEANIVHKGTLNEIPAVQMDLLI